MANLDEILLHVVREGPATRHQCHDIDRLSGRLARLDNAKRIQLLQQLLCVRQAEPPLPEAILEGIDIELQSRKRQRLLTRIDSIPAVGTFSSSIRGSVWSGDITTLSRGVTAITNAANSSGLGCFQPSHRCIDNAIHAWAGPRLRQDCYALMRRRACCLEPGDVIVTGGHCLPANHVIHVVGPQLEPDTDPDETECQQLGRCYGTVLEAVEQLAAEADGGKRVVFCGISTGLFAFPAAKAAEIAIQATAQWFQEHAQSTVTDVIFNTLTAADQDVYQTALSLPRSGWQPCLGPVSRSGPVIECDSLERARHWLKDADAIVVSAGAGLSAAAGLDYTSTSLFAQRFPGFVKYGLSTLYSVFGFSAWPTEEDRWGYLFTHLNLVKTWPQSPLYRALIAWLHSFGQEAHVRTSNADGLFVANGWPADKLSTPQGSYSVVQCLNNCRLEATEPSAAWLEAALPALDGVTQRLTDTSKVPLCRYCGSKMSICVRAADWFNDGPFQDGEECWRRFRERLRSQKKRTVLLELGVGLSTPGVLRWPNELLTRAGDGNIKLIRAGMGPEVAVPKDLENKGLATAIDGDMAATIARLCCWQGMEDCA
ncbi:hypothetical protein CDD81_1260 [Ophiocordyceps australis]|uniref:Uncharacterized protein n=1 Tax=Ophiocordyceps australis TaxID=1399860 RepID=A0A2C5YG91_9HYPO|nr:hypothetical protein CDD81_1260 [Ophiocordyceps australis]